MEVRRCRFSRSYVSGKTSFKKLLFKTRRGNEIPYKTKLKLNVLCGSWEKESYRYIFFKNTKSCSLNFRRLLRVVFISSVTKVDPAVTSFIIKKGRVTIEIIRLYQTSHAIRLSCYIFGGRSRIIKGLGECIVEMSQLKLMPIFSCFEMVTCLF